MIYGVLFVLACLVIGMLLAIFIDQKVSAEGVLRTVFLYPYAMSFVATGLVWQWILNPELGIQEVLRRLGFVHARFDWIVDQDRVIYTLVIANGLAGVGARDGIVVSGASGYRRRNLEGGAHRWYSALARLREHRDPDARRRPFPPRSSCCS